AGRGIEPPDVSLEVGREPDFALLVRGKPVRPGAGALQWEFLDRARPGIESAQLVRQLPRVPERSVRSDLRVMRPRIGSGHVPLANDDFPSLRSEAEQKKNQGWNGQSPFPP